MINGLTMRKEENERKNAIKRGGRGRTRECWMIRKRYVKQEIRGKERKRDE